MFQILSWYIFVWEGSRIGLKQQIFSFRIFPALQPFTPNVSYSCLFNVFIWLWCPPALTNYGFIIISELFFLLCRFYPSYRLHGTIYVVCIFFPSSLPSLCFFPAWMLYLGGLYFTSVWPQIQVCNVIFCSSIIALLRGRCLYQTFDLPYLNGSVINLHPHPHNSRAPLSL